MYIRAICAIRMIIKIQYFDRCVSAAYLIIENSAYRSKESAGKMRVRGRNIIYLITLSGDEWNEILEVLHARKLGRPCKRYSIYVHKYTYRDQYKHTYGYNIIEEKQCRIGGITTNGSYIRCAWNVCGPLLWSWDCGTFWSLFEL